MKHLKKLVVKNYVITDDEIDSHPPPDTVQDLCISGVELKSKQTADCVNQITYMRLVV